MAMAASNEDLLIEAYKSSLVHRDWIRSNPEEFKSNYDDMLLQQVFLEGYYRRNKILIDDIVHDMGLDTKENRRLQEGMWTELATDIGIGLATKIPFIGPAVAVGGMIYYLARMLTAWGKGEKFTAAFEAMSAIGVSAAVVPGVGDAINALMKTIGRWASKIIKFFTPGGKIFGPLMKISKYLKGGAGIADDVAKAEAIALKEALGGNTGKVAAGAIKKVSGTLETIIKWTKGPKAAMVFSKIPGGNKIIGIFETLALNLKSLGSLADNILTAEGDDILKAVMNSSDDIAKVAETAGSKALNAEMAALKAEKASISSQMKATSKSARSASKAAKGSKEALAVAKGADDAALKAGDALKKELNLIRDGAMEVGVDGLDPSLVNNISRAAVGNSDDIIRMASKEFPEAFKNVGPDDLAKAFFPSGKTTSALKSQLKKAGLLSPEMIKLTGDDFAKAFSKEFVEGAGEITIKEVTRDGAGRVAVKVVGKNGAALSMTPHRIIQTFGLDEGVGMCYRIFEGGIEEATQALVEKAAKEMTEKAAESAAKRGIATGFASELKAINAEIAVLAEKMTKEAMEEVAEGGGREVLEKVTQAAPKLVNSDEVVKELTIHMSTVVTGRMGAYITRRLEPTYVEAYQGTYGTAEDARMSPEQRQTAQGVNEIKAHINEMHGLNQLCFESKKRNQLIRSQKLIKFIN